MIDLDELAARFRALAPPTVESAAVVPVAQGRRGDLVLLPGGTATTVALTPAVALREVLRLRSADGWVLLHRHLARAAASRADLALTRRLVAASAVIGVPLLSHLVVAHDGWTDCLADARDELRRCA